MFLKLPPESVRLRRLVRAVAAGEISEGEYRRARREIIDGFAAGPADARDVVARPGGETLRRSDDTLRRGDENLRRGGSTLARGGDLPGRSADLPGRSGDLPGRSGRATAIAGAPSAADASAAKPASAVPKRRLWILVTALVVVAALLTLPWVR
jgi:hypothetical protein